MLGYTCLDAGCPCHSTPTDKSGWEEETKEAKLLTFLKELDNSVFVTTTTESFDGKEDITEELNPVVRDLEGTIQISGEWDREDLKNILASLSDTQGYERALREMEEESPDLSVNYPEDLFPEPWEGWQKDVDELARNKGFRIDNISAHFGRRFGKLALSQVRDTINRKLQK